VYPELNSTTGKLVVADENRGLYIKGLTDGGENPTTKIKSLNIQGGNLGYYSYKLLKDYITASLKSLKSTSKTVNMTDVQWSPYVRIEDTETVYDDSETYYIDNEHFGLKEYEFTTND
jgi:hypothetical protein